jgi:hypothetical protein
MSRAPYPPWFNYRNTVMWRIQAVKFIMQFSPWSVFLHFRPKYLAQHSVLKAFSLCSSLKVRDQVSYPYRTTGKIADLRILVWSFLIWGGKILISLIWLSVEILDCVWSKCTEQNMFCEIDSLLLCVLYIQIGLFVLSDHCDKDLPFVQYLHIHRSSPT